MALSLASNVASSVASSVVSGVRRLWDGLRSGYRRIEEDLREFLRRNLTVFTECELATYETLTFLTPQDIQRVYRKFVKIRGGEFSEDNKNPVVGVNVVLRTRELRSNPFKDRIVQVFAYSRPFMSFEEYLNMISVFSPDAPLKVKAQYAFKIYDFNEDNLLCKEDLKELLTRLRGRNFLKSWIVNDITDMIMSEADIDGDGYLNASEFEHSLSKNPDFITTFKMKI